ncbi:DUF349 domain-containing protein [Schaalia turicensis]
MALQRHLGAVRAHFARILALLFVLVGFVLACATPSFAQGDGKSANSPFLKDSLSDTFTVLSSCSGLDATHLIAVYLDGNGTLLQRSEALANPLTGEKLDAKVWAVGTYDAQKERFVAPVEIPNGTNNADGTLWEANAAHQLTVFYLTKDGHALKARRAVVEAAEAIIAQAPERIHWKQSGQKLRDLLDEWKSLQRKGPRIEKAVEDELWKRFSSARTQFDRQRRQYFSALDQAQSEAKRVKEAIIAEAEALQTSTDWGATSGAYRELMNRWKAAPRASRKEDDALWARFRAAQQVFFDARRAKDEATDSEYRENLAAKEALADEAEKILPVEDLEAAKTALRSVQDRWEEIGRVPSSDLHRIEGRLRAVESAIREAEENEWRRTNPETRARAQGMLGQLEAQVESLESDLSVAKAKGDEKKVKSLTEALETKRTWLAQIRASME